MQPWLIIYAAATVIFLILLSPVVYTIARLFSISEFISNSNTWHSSEHEHDSIPLHCTLIYKPTHTYTPICVTYPMWKFVILVLQNLQKGKQDLSFHVVLVRNKSWSVCLDKHTGARENFRFNQIIIDDVTIIFCKYGSSLFYKIINFIFKRPINIALECVEFELPWKRRKYQIRLF